ncbi:hypothetical protein [Corallococcus sicarius]|uniref:hypothetical protein n=1 Tax=Corallococcus sicarius TaxID=2316726 RepID=UPI0011C3A70E|nr:hypothetical protein [Corallococcus sicarius]
MRPAGGEGSRAGVSGSSARRFLVGLLGAASLWAVAAACSGGVKVDEGNAFPCDLTQSEDVRDTACPPAWRCGIDNRCHEATEESVTSASEPTFEATRRYPVLLEGDARMVASDTRGGQVVVGHADGGAFLSNGRVVRALTVEPPALTPAQLAFTGTRVAVVTPRSAVSGENALLLGRLDDTRPQVAALTVEPAVVTRGVRGLRTAPGRLERGLLAVLLDTLGAGEVAPDTGAYTLYPGALRALPDAGVEVCGAAPLPPCPPGSLLPYLDVRPVPTSLFTKDAGAGPDALPVVVTPEYFFWRAPTSVPGGRDTWKVLNPEDPISAGGAPSPATAERAAVWSLRHSETAEVWALRRPLDGRHVLGTWVLRRSGGEPRLERAWADCTPCGSGRLVAFTPVSDGALGVEVLCESAQAGRRTLARVVGSSVVNPSDACLTQPLEAPVDFSELSSDGTTGTRLARAGAVDDAQGAGALLGGEHGQVWRGRTLSTLRPLYLDRVPLSVAALGNGLLALTRDYLSLEVPDSRLPARVGLSVTASSVEADGGVLEQPALGGLVEGSAGWLVLESGQVAKVNTQGTTADVSLGSTYGPQLLAPSGAPTSGPFLGQGATADGGSLVIAANDQLYYLEGISPTTEPGQLAGVLPRLTPDPGFPVRSLARDRTVSLTGATPQRVRGWVATGRGLFEYAQSKEGRWSLTPLPLGDAEPVKVWSREGGGVGYGRVGLRDGVVLRLPEGLPLTQPLPDEGRVVDYVSLAGWPVALTETDVYAATVRGTRADGQAGLLQWMPLSRPVGLTNEALLGARIFVVKHDSEEVLYLFTRTGFVYQLGKGRP